MLNSSGGSSEPFKIRSGVKQRIWDFHCSAAKPQQKESTFALDQMAGSSTSPVSELRERYARFSSGTCCLLMMQQLWFSPRRNSRFQSLMDSSSQACKDFGLTISLKKTNVLGQDTEAPLVITIDDYKLDAVCQFTYLGSTTTDNLHCDAEIDKRIGKADSTLARLTARVWTSPKLSVKTKMAVYNACVTSTLLYGSETWTTYAGQERRLNTFHQRSIHHILGISW